MELIQSKVDCTETGIEFPESLSYEEWQSVGQSLQRIGRSWQWWIGDWLNFGEKKYGERYAQAIEETGIEYGTLRNCAYVASNVELSLRSDKVSWSHHKCLASLPQEEQKIWLDRVQSDALSVSELNKELRQQRIADQRATTPALPEGVFDLILMDPPWQYDFAETDNRKIENHYPTMTLEQLEELELPAADDCVLLMWATAPKLLEAYSVLGAWGFTYKTNAVWDKEQLGMGYWFRGQHEFLMVATKGEVSPPESSHRVSSVFREKRGRHSAKPECVYRWIEEAFPNVSKCEMFCRVPREGWSVWGNEV